VVGDGGVVTTSVTALLGEEPSWASHDAN